MAAILNFGFEAINNSFLERKKCLITFLNAKRKILLDLDYFRLRIKIYCFIYEKPDLKIVFC